MTRTAFYALRPGGWRDYVTLLHPPYTLWHLSYVVIGAAIAPEWLPLRLGAALAAFALGLGVGAHALDELRGHPLGTRIPDRVLWALALVSLAGAIAIGIAAAVAWTPWLAVFVVFGGFIAVAYNLELFGGRFHSDLWFAVAWGSLPLLAAFFASAEELRAEGIVAAIAAGLISFAQRRLSTPVRLVRREEPDLAPAAAAALLRGPEDALRALTAAMICLAVALVLFRAG